MELVNSSNLSYLSFKKHNHSSSSALRAFLYTYEFFSFFLLRHVTSFLWGSWQAKLLPVCKPQWPVDVGQVAGERGILGKSHLHPPQEHLDPRLWLTRVPCKTRLLLICCCTSPLPNQIQTLGQLPQGHAVQTVRSAAHHITLSNHQCCWFFLFMIITKKLMRSWWQGWNWKLAA